MIANVGYAAGFILAVCLPYILGSVGFMLGGLEVVVWLGLVLVTGFMGIRKMTANSRTKRHAETAGR